MTWEEFLTRFKAFLNEAFNPRYEESKPRSMPEESERQMVRTASILIGELERDFDEIALGKAQKEDWRIEMGLSDARRDLKELCRAITEAEG